MGGCVVILMFEGQSIRCTASEQDFIAGHAAGDLRQPHCVARHARRIDRIADRQIGVVRQDFSGLGEGFFERICWVIGWL